MRRQVVVVVTIDILLLLQFQRGQTGSCSSSNIPTLQKKRWTPPDQVYHKGKQEHIYEWHRGFVRELVFRILFERRMWHFELPAGVEVIGWIQMFSHPYHVQVDNAVILLASSPWGLHSLCSSKP